MDEKILTWIDAWQLKLQDKGYELIVAHPADYHDLRTRLVLPEHIKIEWSEEVMRGHPLVFENASNFPH